MKRARKKGSYNAYDDIDVPEIVHQNYVKHNSVQKKSAKKSSSTRKNINKAPKSTYNSRKKTTAKKKKGNKPAKAILLLLLAIILLFFIFMGMGWSGSDETGALIPVDMGKGKLNVLLLGVDNDGLRTDAMMLVSYDMKEASAQLLSIPRDTQMKITDRNVTRKINEIHAMHDKNNKLIGPMGSIKAVTALTGLPIHYYVEFSFNAIDELADVIGPIEFDVPDVEGKGRGMNYDDPTQDLHIHLKPGLQKLSGNQVQQFLRYRKSNSGAGDGSDLSRVKRQQEFLKAVVDQKVNLGLIAKIPSIFSKIKENIKTNFSVGDAIKYAKYLNGLTSEKLTTHRLPGESKSTSSGWYFVCDLEETAGLMQDSFGYDVSGLTNKITVNDIDGTKNVLSSNKPENNDDNDIEESNKTPEPTPEANEEHTDVEDSYEGEDYDYDGDIDIEEYIPEEETQTEPPQQTLAPVHTPPPSITSEPEDPTPVPETTPDENVEDDVITLD